MFRQREVASVPDAILNDHRTSCTSPLDQFGIANDRHPSAKIWRTVDLQRWSTRKLDLWVGHSSHDFGPHLLSGFHDELGRHDDARSVVRATDPDIP
jgi:hypothetical protein